MDNGRSTVDQVTLLIQYKTSKTSSAQRKSWDSVSGHVCSVVVAKKPESIRHEILNTLATKSHARYVVILMLNDRVTSYVIAGAQTV